MSVSTILDPSTGKIAPSFLPSSSLPTDPTFDSVSFTLFPGPPPSTAAGSDVILSAPLAGTTDSFVAVGVGGVPSAATLLTGPLFAHTYSDPYGGNTNKMELDGTTLRYYQAGTGATFPILTANPVKGSSALTNIASIDVNQITSVADITGDATTGAVLSNITTINGTRFPPESGTIEMPNPTTTFNVGTSQNLSPKSIISLTAFDNGDANFQIPNGTAFYYTLTTPTSFTITATQPAGPGGKLVVNWSILSV